MMEVILDRREARAIGTWPFLWLGHVANRKYVGINRNKNKF
jgi:hypothetical protein